ncbi:MAG: helix-turn-helix domain-containing protein [Christensenellales bacterium]
MTLSYNKLWKLLIDKNIKKMQLCEISGISTNAMAKLGKDESVQLDVLVKICEVLNCDIGDIVEVKKEEENING